MVRRSRHEVHRPFLEVYCKGIGLLEAPSDCQLKMAASKRKVTLSVALSAEARPRNATCDVIKASAIP